MAEGTMLLCWACEEHLTPRQCWANLCCRGVIWPHSGASFPRRRGGALAGCASASACSFVGEGARTCCVPGRSKSNGGWQLWELRQPGRLLLMTLPLTHTLLIASSVIEQRLYHLLSLNTWRWASRCLSPTSVNFSFCILVFAESRNVWRAGGLWEGNVKGVQSFPEWQPAPHSWHQGCSYLQPMLCPIPGTCADGPMGS